MDNPHRQIRGYRELDQWDIDLINLVKEYGGDLRELIEDLERDPGVDKRWLAIAKTDLQKGFMSLIRSIAKPESF